MPRSVSVSITANTGGFTSGMAAVASSAQAAAGSVKSSFDKGLGSITKSGPHLDKIGSSLGKIGAVGAVGLGLSAKAAIDWESSFAGVMKTTNDSAAGFKVLEGQLRGLAKTMPATHAEIAGVAEAAGQLGISREGLVPFTKTMIQLGDTTNLSAEEAATSLAQLMNVMGTAPTQVGALGDAIVNLGNNGASTERDIVQMGQRIAGAGKQIGLSENEVLAFASAISSTGIETEAGGTAISQTFQKIDKAVSKGGASLDILAKTSGVSSAEFAQSWGQDAAGATEQFIQGLAKIQAAGGNASSVLDSLGITGQRQQDVLLRLAGATKTAGNATNLLADQFGFAKDSVAALTNEAQKRYTTTASQIQISLNNIQDAGITAGGAILPVLSNLASGAAKAAGAFGNLSAPVQSFAVKGVAFATAAALIGSGVIKAVTGVAALRTAMVGLSTTAPAAAGALRGLGLAAAGIGAAFVGIQAVGAVTRQFKSNFVSDITAANKALLDLGTTGSQVNLDKIFNFDISGFGNDALIGANGIHGLSQALDLIKDPSGLDQIRVGIDKIAGTTGQLTSVQLAFDGLDQSLTGLSTGGHADQAAASFTKLRTAAEAQGVPLDKLINLFPQYKESILAAAGAAKIAVTSDQQLADLMGTGLPAGLAKTAAGADAAKKSIKGMSFDEQQASIDSALNALNRYGNSMLAVSSGASGLEGAVDAASQAFKENGRTLDQNTAKGRANQGALDQLTVAANSNAGAMVKAGASQQAVNAAVGRSRGAYARTAHDMGLTSKAARAVAVDLIKIPNAKNIRIVTSGAKVSVSQAAILNHELKKIPKETRAKVVATAETRGAAAAMRQIERIKIKEKKAKVSADTSAAGSKLKSFFGQKPKDIKIGSKVDKPKAPKVDKPKDVKIGAKIDAPKSPKVPKPKDIKIGVKVGKTPAVKTPKGSTVTIKVKVGKVPSIKVPQPKTIQIRTSANVSGASKVKSAIAGLKPRTIAVKTTGNISGASKVKSAIAGVKPKTVTVTVRANTGGAAAARAAVNSVHSSTVTITTIHVSKSVKKAEGGYIRGAGTPTSDSIPAWLSDGEYVIRAAAVRAVGLGALDALNAKGYKEGGHVGLGYAKGGKAKDPAAGGDPDKEIRVVLDLEHQLENAKSTKELIDITKKLEAANKKLYDSQKNMAESIKGLSASLIEPYRTKSKDIDDWLEAMKEGTTDLNAFKDDVKKLRKLGLSDALIKQISEQGAVAGDELAQQILQGGKGLADSLNKANKGLEDAAKTAGGAVTIVKGYAAGGPISGSGTGTSDSVDIRASKGEWIVPAAATERNRSVLEAITFGRTVIDHRFVPHFARGGMVQPAVEKNYHAGDIYLQPTVADPDLWMRKARNAQRDSQIMYGLASVSV